MQPVVKDASEYCRWPIHMSPASSDQEQKQKSQFLKKQT